MTYITLDEAITYYDELCPNQYSREQKTRWISELDERIYEDIIKPRLPRCRHTYTIADTDAGQEVTVPLTLYDYNANLGAAGTAFTQSQIGTTVTFTADINGDDTGKVFGSFAFNGYDDNTLGETVLIAPSMYKDIYRYWLEKNVSIANREVGAANNAIASFETTYEDYYGYINSHNRVTEIHQLKFR